ncbi:MAG: hypothetical protein V4448_16040 [Pseudomonadota bacterium]
MAVFGSFFMEENEGDANIYSVYRLLYQYAMRQEEIEFIRGRKKKFSKENLDFNDVFFHEEYAHKWHKKSIHSEWMLTFLIL